MLPAPVRIALVGLGGHGRRIQDAVARVAGLDVRAVYDVNDREVQAAAERFGAEAAVSYPALLERSDLDAVVLATPNALHRAQAETAFEAGHDVFVEKPIANTVADGRAMVQAAEEAGRLLMVGHNMRWGRAARAARELLEAGRLGEVVSVELHFSADNVQKGTHEGWRFVPGQCPLLPMMQLGIHAIDLVQVLLGPIRHVWAHARSVLTEPGIIDAVTASFVLERGLAGTAVSNYCTPDLFEVRLAGTAGVLVVNWIPHALTLLPRGARTDEPEHHDYAAYDLEDQVLQFAAFAEAVRTRRPPATDGRAGLQALAVVEAMAQSAEQGLQVDVEGI